MMSKKIEQQFSVIRSTINVRIVRRIKRNRNTKIRSIRTQNGFMQNIRKERYTKYDLNSFDATTVDTQHTCDNNKFKIVYLMLSSRLHLLTQTKRKAKSNSSCNNISENRTRTTQTTTNRTVCFEFRLFFVFIRMAVVALTSRSIG